MSKGNITKDAIIAALAGLSESEIHEVIGHAMSHIEWSDVGGQGVFATVMGDMTLLAYNHTQNFGTPIKTNGKSAKHPRVASSLGFKGVPGATLGVVFQLNVIDTARMTTQVGEPAASGEE